uniref:ribulose-phosphate 3-epimerase n=1 Tax=Ciona savignyi TaxID=51511 RepID=H2YTC1_CIOSA
MCAYQCKIGPSILNSDLARLGDECKRMLECGADYLHLDVMDGHFVPNITFGHPVVQCIRKSIGDSPVCEVHMMVSKPEQWVKAMAESGANIYTFHLEAAENAEQLIKDVRELRKVHPTLDIGVDGGVGPNCIHHCAEAGANMIVSGSAIMRSNDPRKVITDLRNVVQEVIQQTTLER